MAAAEQKHPFPAAISEGLAPAAEIPQATQAAPGTVHTQIADSLSYTAPTADAAPAGDKKTAAPAPAAGQAALPPPPPQKRDVLHVVGRFFKRMFGG